MERDISDPREGEKKKYGKNTNLYDFVLEGNMCIVNVCIMYGLSVELC
jgi:hypothetical protein